MIKKIITTVLAMLFIGLIGVALRLWLVKNSVEQINTVVMDATAKAMNRLKSTTSQISVPAIPIQVANSDQQPPKANPQDWDSISNMQQICWIHKKTHKKVCEQK